MLRRGADDFAVRRERAVDVPQLASADLAEAVLELEHFVRRLGDLGLAGEHVASSAQRSVCA